MTEKLALSEQSGFQGEKRFVDALAMFVVALMSLMLLVYVAYGEAKRTYEQFQIEKLVAQGQVLQSAVEGFVRPGFPIHQFGGFVGIAEPMAKADPLVDSISAFDVLGARVFVAGELNSASISSAAEITELKEKGAQIRRSQEFLQVSLPVRNRFETVGQVVISLQRAKLVDQVDQAFQMVVKVAIGAAFGFAAFVFLLSSRSAPATRTNWVTFGFVMTFLGVSVFVVSTLVSVYSLGAQARTKSLADSLGQRLDDLIIYNINLDDITGIIGLFGDYKRLNPDLRAAALIVDGKIRAHVDPARRGTEWDSVPSDHEYAVKLSPEGAPREVLVKVALPRDVVFKQVLRSVKNFGALLVASALFAALFMGLARSLQLLANVRDDKVLTADQEIATIELAKPVFFLAVFVEHLSYAFLPSLMQSYAVAANLSSSFASAPFMAYYICFALALSPAGRIEAKLGARNVILVGLAMAVFGLGCMTIVTDFWQATVARAICGLGQGTLFIGVQAYVLSNSSAERKTRAGGAIVFGFQAGMIAGMAIGSLLVSYMDTKGIFQLGATLALLTGIYGFFALPAHVSKPGTSLVSNSILKDMKLLLTDAQFLKTMFLIGVPAKAVLTGTVLFALPILLTKQGFLKEDVGQIIMVYAGAVILSSHFASAHADSNRNTESMLFKGAFLTAAGLIMMSLVGFPDIINWETGSFLGTAMIVFGALIVGIAHGYINAPVVSHVIDSQITSTVGMVNTAATYRLVERLGHVAGPLIMGQIFIFGGVSWTVLMGVGLAVLVLGTLFLSSDKPVPSHNNAHTA
jgi:MFS family permease